MSKNPTSSALENALAASDFVASLDSMPPEAIVIGPHLGAFIERLPYQERLSAILAIGRDVGLIRAERERHAVAIGFGKECPIDEPSERGRGKRTPDTIAALGRRDALIAALARILDPVRGASGESVRRKVALRAASRNPPSTEADRVADDVLIANRRRVPSVRTCQAACKKFRATKT